MTRLLPEEQRALTHYIYSISAISLDASKAYLIEGRLGGMLSELGCRTFSELLFRAQTDATGGIRRKIIDSITTGETLFFRDSAPFDLLKHKILPDLIDQRSRSAYKSPIRIWSAACSTGQEVYSIAIVLKELLQDPDGFGVRLLGTDISNQAVAHASRGVFSALEVSRGLSDPTLMKYFLRAGESWKVRDEIRALTSFKTLNLMEDFSALGRFDIVFCRNVAIYFNERDKIALFQRLGRALSPGGYLLVGAMESLSASAPQFEPKRHLRSVYYQLKG